MAKSNERKGFVFYFDWKERIEILEDDELKRFIINLINYHTGEELSLETKTDKLVWTGVINALKENDRKYYEMVERNRQNGKKGGRPKKEEEKPNGFSENPNNPIIDNRKKITDNKEEIIENRKEEIVKSKKLIDNLESNEFSKNDSNLGNVDKPYPNSDNTIGISLPKEKNNILQIEFQNIFKYDNTVIRNLYTKIGRDIIDSEGIKEYNRRIKQSWDSPNSDKYKELSNISFEISTILKEGVRSESKFDNLLQEEYNKLHPTFFTENNIRLSQLYLNLHDFLFDNESLFIKNEPVI